MDYIQTEEFQKEMDLAMHFVAEHHINKKNFPKFQKQIRTFFENDKAYKFYIQNYLLNTESIKLDQFIPKDINVDCFPVRRSQNDKFFVTDFIEIKYIMHGSVTQTLDGRTYLLRENDLCVVAPYVQQSTYLWDNSDEVINIALRPERFSQVFTKIMQFPNLFQQLYEDFSEGHQASYLVIGMNQNPEIKALLEKLLELCLQRGEQTLEGATVRQHANDRVVKNLLVESVAEHLILLILQQNAIYRTEVNNLPDVKMPFIHSFIRKHLADVSLQMIADELGYSRSHTGRYIQEMTGRTYTELLQTIRIREAASLLQNTTMAVDEIMETVGYTGKANFYQLFEQYYHSTPAKYRKHSSE
ncbi:MAG: AraC family transcriptional regulator [Eubacteriales bacterium]|nr:AraC family transcriptional regulator [Eubacteriales bacterium]